MTVNPVNPSTARPLEGVKIVDFMWAMAGPAASRVLADYGAEIIRVESANKIDAVRTLQPFRDDVTDPELSGIWNNMNAGKQGLALDMSKPGAIDVIWDLFDWADVIMESFSPRAMAAWGIDYEQVRQRRPDIIMTSSCLMGQTGPLSMLAGFGTMAAAISGFFYPVGWTDRAPAGPFGAYTDYTSPRWLVAAVMAALEHKRATGQGQYIDLSQAESALHLLAPGLLDRSVNGRIWERDGNRDLVFAPQGVYRCVGDDNWVAVACTSDEAWATLAERDRPGRPGRPHPGRAPHPPRRARHRHRRLDRHPGLHGRHAPAAGQGGAGPCGGERPRVPGRPPDRPPAPLRGGGPRQAGHHIRGGHAVQAVAALRPPSPTAPRPSASTRSRS